MTNCRHHILIALLVLIMCFTGPLYADDEIDQDDAAVLRKQGLVLPLEKILAAAKRYRSGRVVDVELEKKRERYVYEIEVVDSSGRVWEMKINAGDATLISEEQED